ncbi:MAG: ribosome-binding factor [Acidobacteriales bacterium]|nr:ribosome-binding factor [Terriglobales bacterium]
MPERRGASHHRDRVVEALKDEVGSILEGELADKRIGLCYVTEVVMNPGGKSARIYISVDGDEQEAEQTMEGLTAARVYIRNEVRDRLGKRHIPELSFHLDRSQEFGGRIDQLLDRVAKRARKSQT